MFSVFRVHFVKWENGCVRIPILLFTGSVSGLCPLSHGYIPDKSSQVWDSADHNVGSVQNETNCRLFP
jgi:hypothetical protein